MLHHAYNVVRQTVHDWNHGLTVGIGLGWFTQSVELAGKLLGVVAILVGIVCSIRKDRRETNAALSRARS